jgi:hypothetical protein
MLRIFIVLTLLLAALHAEPAAVEASQPATANPEAEQKVAKPAIIKLDNGMMQIGLVTFDPRTRQVRVPCTVNMTEGQIEYAVVNEKGKIHEALLCTKASPTDVNIACKLLRYVSSEELYAIQDATGLSTGKYPEVSESTRKAARVNLRVEWTKDGHLQTTRFADWIINSVTSKTMSVEPWVYGGSMMYNGKFLAETSGDIASILVSNDSLILYAGADKFNDEVWLPNTRRMPEQGARVTFVIQPN